MNKALLILVLLLGSEFSATAQRVFERKHPPIFHTDGKMRQGGFYFGPGATYMLTRFKNSEETIFQNADTTLNATFDPGGRVGIYLEAGWFHAFRHPVFFQYWDAGLAYKQLKGTQDHVSVVRVNDLFDSTLYTGSAAFNESYVTAHFNLNKVLQVGDYSFVQASIGANVDYRLSRSIARDGLHLFHQEKFPPSLVGQLHAKIGYGFKVTRKLMVIPALETPILNIQPWDGGKSTLQYFSSRYRPIILSVRFLFLRHPKGFDCPTPPKQVGGKPKIYKPDGYHPN